MILAILITAGVVVAGLIWARAQGLLGETSRTWAAMVAVAGVAGAFVAWLMRRGGSSDAPVRAQLEENAVTRVAIDAAEVELADDIAQVETETAAAVADVRVELAPSADLDDAARRFDDAFPL